MHELSATKQIIGLINDECKKAGIKKPSIVKVEIGLLTTYRKDAMLFYFNILKEKETFLLNTKLDINELAGKIKCNKCNKESVVEESYLMVCPICGSTDVKIIEGNDIIVKEIEGD